MGWIRIRGLDGVTRDCYVRPFHDWKGGADVSNLLPPGPTRRARVCGATLARARARPVAAGARRTSMLAMVPWCPGSPAIPGSRKPGNAL